MKAVKLYNNGQWTTARMRSFVMSALRRAQWPVKYASINKAYVMDGINPKTGRKCKLHKCPCCGGVFPKGKMQADHIDPVIPIERDWDNCFLGYDWNEVIKRMFVETEGFQPICLSCHKAKTSEERKKRNVA